VIDYATYSAFQVCFVKPVGPLFSPLSVCASVRMSIMQSEYVSVGVQTRDVNETLRSETETFQNSVSRLSGDLDFMPGTNWKKTIAMRNCYQCY